MGVARFQSPATGHKTPLPSGQTPDPRPQPLIQCLPPRRLADTVADPLGRMPERPNGVGCKPTGESLRRFESCSAHSSYPASSPRFVPSILCTHDRGMTGPGFPDEPGCGSGTPRQPQPPPAITEHSLDAMIPCVVASVQAAADAIDVRDDVHEAFFDLACCVIGWRRLGKGHW